MEPFIGMIMMWSGSFAPKGWLFCHGQRIPINEYQSLFSLIGTTYGGDGYSTFQLPDLRGRVPLGAGTSPQGGQYSQGEAGGDAVQNLALSVNNLPSHTHELSEGNIEIAQSTTVDLTMNVSTDPGERGVAQQGDYFGAPTSSSRGVPLYRGDANKNVAVSGLSGSVQPHSATMTGTIGHTGQGQAVQFPNMQPYLAIEYIIACEGIYPPRQ
ncbi:tail fiber protein [uncultured Desulfuromonas sp.]|uniref:phage tail protein n=1 Tax=uncultured Desulfuromonas sp. TaxID=181013 RepID=UPI002AAB08E6|nr:tail fiber protein [uncultured Desulfuromonas sp.]